LSPVFTVTPSSAVSVPVWSLAPRAYDPPAVGQMTEPFFVIRSSAPSPPTTLLNARPRMLIVPVDGAVHVRDIHCVAVAVGLASNCPMDPAADVQVLVVEL
jgi:hypothetical protein